ncbi:MAG: DUF2470 domain-containing protein [Cyanobacteria bacterium J083]|nr:MAG: DUF2470 domain-containing protein [Cyanobacteria bacterium J083]
MSEAITPAISDRICKHMNKDHPEAIITYAQVYGNIPQPESATMLSIDAKGMDIAVQVAGETLPVRVNFDHTLKDAKDAHTTLVEMLKKA